MSTGPVPIKLSASDFGRNWSTFNVEQQASIVESWYVTERVRKTFRKPDGIHGGSMSEHDVRFPYIRDVIRARNRNAGYHRRRYRQAGTRRSRRFKTSWSHLVTSTRGGRMASSDAVGVPHSMQ